MCSISSPAVFDLVLAKEQAKELVRQLHLASQRFGPATEKRCNPRVTYLTMRSHIVTYPLELVS